MVLDEWQELVVQSAMGERSDATWAAKRVGLSVPRQNGKSQLLVSRALAGALLFGERKIVISAHQQDTARESFSKLLELIEADANGWLRERVRPNGIMQALNREAVRFRNGATIQFKARSGSGSRGFSSDCLMLDEAQILSQRAWVSINSTMSAMPNPQVWLLGTPPTPEDDGAVFGAIRGAAHKGTATSTAWLEWAADPQADPALEETRWSANPAWNVRINHEVVQGEFETYPADRFALDRLGIWLADQAFSALPDWGGLVSSAPDITRGALGVACDVEETRVAACWAEVGDPAFVAVNDARPWTERAAFAAHVADVQSRRQCAVVVRAKSTLIPELETAGVRITLADRDTRIQAASDLALATQRGTVKHGDYPELNAAVAAAKWRTLDGRRVLVDLRGELEAAALAHWAAMNAPEPDPAAYFV